MSQKLPPSASVATSSGGAKLHAPAAERNAQALCDLLIRYAPHKGFALEIASGTGQHIRAFAKALPRLEWQPTEVAPDRMASIGTYVAEAQVSNVKPAQYLDVTVPDWRVSFGPRDLVVLVNLLHLVSTAHAQTIIEEAIGTLSMDGRFVLYGPFMRQGRLISDGDARFDAQLRAADPSIGYKNDTDIAAWLTAAGASEVVQVDMPANNLAFIAKR